MPSVTDRAHLRIYGGVQGVGFRAFTRKTARDLALCGYVRNCPDGSVEIEATGSPDALARFRAAVTRGPPYATVERVDEFPATSLELGTTFDVRP